MTVHELQQEILRLKREKNICILAHAYQSQPVLEVADYTGDSYGLSVQAAKTNHVRCALHGRDLQNFKPGENRLAGQPHGGLPYGRAA